MKRRSLVISSLLLLVAFICATMLLPAPRGFAQSDMWSSDSGIVSGLGDVGSHGTATVFELDGDTYLIAGELDSVINGYKRGGSSWSSNSAIVSGLSASSLRFAATVFELAGDTYLIAGDWDGDFYGYKWGGSSWSSNSAIVSGLSDSAQGINPVVFELDGDTYLVNGNSRGRFSGFKWNGSSWSTNSAITSGLGDIGGNSAPTVFELAGDTYLISGKFYGSFHGFKWGGSSWSSNSGIVSGLSDVGSLSAPTVFDMDGDLYLISASYAGTFTGWIADTGPTPTPTATSTNTPTATPNCTAIATDCAYCAPAPTATPECDDYNFTLSNDGWHGFGNHIEFELSHSYTNSVSVNDMLVYWSPAATVAAHDGYTLAIGSLSTTGGWTCDPADSHPDTASFDECPNGVWLPYEVSNSSSNADFGAFVHTSLGGITHGTTISTDYGIRLFLDNGCQVVVTPAPRAFDTPTPTATPTPPPTSEWGCEWVSATANLPWTGSTVYTWTIPGGTSGVIEDVRVAPAPGTNIAEGYFWVPDTSGMDVGGYCDDGVEWYAPVRAVSGVAEQDGGGPAYTVGELDFCMSNICAPTATPPACEYTVHAVDVGPVYASFHIYNNSSQDVTMTNVVVDWTAADALDAANCSADLSLDLMYNQPNGESAVTVWTGTDYNSRTAGAEGSWSNDVLVANDYSFFEILFSDVPAGFADLDDADFGIEVELSDGCRAIATAQPVAYPPCTPTPPATETPDCAEYDVAVTEMIYSVSEDLFEAYRVTLTNTSATTVTIERISVDWWPVKTGNAVLYGDLTTNIDWLGWTTSTNHVWGLAGEDGINDPMPETDTALDLPATFISFTLPSMTYGDLYIDFDSGSQEYFTSTYALDNIGVQVYLDNGCVINTAPVTYTIPACESMVISGTCSACCELQRALQRYDLCRQGAQTEGELKICEDEFLYWRPQ